MKKSSSLSDQSALDSMAPAGLTQLSMLMLQEAYQLTSLYAFICSFKAYTCTMLIIYSLSPIPLLVSLEQPDGKKNKTRTEFRSHLELSEKEKPDRDISSVAGPQGLHLVSCSAV